MIRQLALQHHEHTLEVVLLAAMQTQLLLLQQPTARVETVIPNKLQIERAAVSTACPRAAFKANGTSSTLSNPKAQEPATIRDDGA